MVPPLRAVLARSMARGMESEEEWREPPVLNPLQEVASLLDAAGLAPRFRTFEASAGTGGGGAAVPSFAAADITSEALHEQFVLHNRPAVVRDLHPGWGPLQWNDVRLRELCGERSIEVRVADAGRQFGDPSRQGMYARESLSLRGFIEALADAEALGKPAPFYAAQLALRRDLPELFADSRPEPPHLRALGPLWRGAPALYIGGSSQTPLHFDAFDNLLCVVRGAKSVLLWPPGCAELLYPGGGGSALFSRADVFAPDLSAFPLLARALPLAVRAELGPGDALYLPCGWWHAVQSQPPPRERCISISYWARQPESKQQRRERDDDVEVGFHV